MTADRSGEPTSADRSGPSSSADRERPGSGTAPLQMRRDATGGGRSEPALDRVRERRTVAGVDLPRLEARLRALVALLLLTIAAMGVYHGRPLVLWLVPVAWVLLAFDPSRPTLDSPRNG